jgi:putative tricarboxylic transport membrane protein
MQSIHRRGNQVAVLRCTLRIAGAALVAMVGFAASAQMPVWKPEKNVELVVGTTAGSALDRTARSVQKIWQDRGMLGVTSTVINKAGGNMSVAAAYLGQHAGDAHYLQFISPTMLTDYITGGSTISYADYSPIALLGSQYLAIATRIDSPIKSGKDLIERLKHDPTSASFGINGVGNNLHILIAVISKESGVDVKRVRTVVFQGGELMTAVIGGHIDLVSTVPSNLLPQLQAGKLRVLGVAAPRRLGGPLADVQTWREQGVDAVVPNWWAVIAPKGLSAAQIDYWDMIFAATTSAEDWKRNLAASFFEPRYLNSAETAGYLRVEYAKLKASLAELGLAKR